jgi:26S proteasome regulatory subunit N12
MAEAIERTPCSHAVIRQHQSLYIHTILLCFVYFKSSYNLSLHFTHTPRTHLSRKMFLPATVAPLLYELSAKYEAGDVVGGQETLNQLKIALLEVPPSLEASQVACQALEMGVLLTVMDGDLDAFGRNVAQLKPHYTMISAAASSSSSTPRKCHILGLNLMHLLVDNRLSEFHAELELLTEQEASNPLVSFPIELERQLMVGLYDQVLATQVPDTSFQFFVDSLLQTVRDSIADCMEVSYKEMSLESAMTMMKYTNAQDLMEYIQECRDDWIVQGNALCFQPPTVGSKVSTDIPSMEWIAQSLSYATEMERII